MFSPAGFTSVFERDTGMTDQLAASMRRRFAGKAVIEKTLSEQAKVRPRGRFARALGVDPLSEEARPWYTGARGEVAVGQILRSLPADWAVFHSLPIGNRETDVDHIVIGPAGLFTINTKSHRGKAVWVAGRTVLVAGQKKVGYIVAAEREAHRVTHLLRTRMPDLPPARPLLAIVAPSKLTVRSRPEQVTVLDATSLPRWLREQSTVLSPEQRMQVTKLVNDPDVWPPRREPAETDAVARFATLEREVRSASIVRACWGLVGIATLVGAGVSILPGVVMSLFP